jgi:uncharacterized protein
MEADQTPQNSEPPDRNQAILACAGALVAILIVLFTLGGEAGNVAQAALPGAPLALLAWLVQLSDRRAAFRVVAWLWFWVVLWAIAMFTLTLTYSAMVDAPGSPPTLDQARKLVPLLAVILAAFVAALILVLVRPWATVARFMGGSMNPFRADHVMGMVGMLVFVLLACAPLAVLDGEAPLLILIQRNPEYVESRSATGQILDLYYGLAWNIPLALVMAGAPGRRNLRGALERLGVRGLRAKEIPALLACTMGMVALAIILDAVIPPVWSALGWRQTDAEAVNRLFGATISPIGAVSVALSAGVGEELLARGLLQPRYGWLLPNLAFAATHAFQYGTDSLLSVFVIGAVLAAVRARWSTSGSMVAHGLYDFTLVGLSLLGIEDV